MADSPRLRPLGIGEILDTGVALYRRHPGALLGLAAIVVVPLQVVVLLVTLSTSPENAGEAIGLLSDFDARTSPAGDDDIWIFFTGSFLATALGLVSATLATATCTKLCADAIVGEQIDPRASLRSVTARWAVVTATGAVIGVAVTAGLLALFVPGILMLGTWAVAMPALVLERSGLGAALRRSAQLVRGRFWPILGVLAAGQALATALQLGLALPLELLVGEPQNVAAASITQGLVTLVTTTLVAPFLAATIVVAYVDLRVRKEGFDVQLLTARLAPPPA